MANAELHVASAEGRTIARAFARPFENLFAALVRIAENSTEVKALNRLQDVTDEDFAARGTTRQAEVLRVLSRYVAI